jgi:hypothetical protein
LAIEVVFLVLVGFLLLFFHVKETVRPGGFLKIPVLVGAAIWMMVLSGLMVVAQKKTSSIPTFKIAWLAGSDWFSDNSKAYGLEPLSSSLAIENPSLIFDSPVENVEFCVPALEGEVWAIERQSDDFTQRLLLDFREEVGLLDIELGAAGAAFGPNVVRRDGYLYLGLGDGGP